MTSAQAKARRMRWLLQNLPDAVRLADRGDTTPLCKFFREWMPEEEGELLADLIERNLQAGRRKGRTRDRHVDNTPSAEMERRVVAIVDRRRAKATSPLKRGLLDKWIIEILNDLGEQGDLQGMNISVESIKANLRRGKKKQGAKVAPKG